MIPSSQVPEAELAAWLVQHQLPVAGAGDATEDRVLAVATCRVRSVTGCACKCQGRVTQAPVPL